MTNQNTFTKPKWIENPDFCGKVSEFVKEFYLEELPLSATLKIVGLGSYSSKINGKLTDGYYFKPLLTDFHVRKGLNNYLYDEYKNGQGRKSIIYDLFDVTDKLCHGKNELLVLVGTGWYHNVIKDCVDPSYDYGNPKLYFEITLKYKDGERKITSDKTTQVRNTACMSDLFGGEYRDFTVQELPFVSSTEVDDIESDMCESRAERDGIIKKFKPKLVSESGKSKIFDFGVNHSGGVILKVRGSKGARLKITHFEFLNKDGTPNLDSCRWLGYEGSTPVAQIDQISEYVLSGNTDLIEPLFHWDCYRFIQIDCDCDYEILSLQSLFIASLVKKDGDFKCSNPVFNKLYKAFLNTQYANMHCGVPSDCPHREKLPYTGDGQVTIKSVLYSLDAYDFYDKWLTDIIDSQDTDGFIPYNAPLIGCGGGGCWWSNAITEIPFAMYQTYGDLNAIKRSLNSVKRLIDFYGTMHNGDYIVVKTTAEWLLGDWIAPDMVVSNNSFVNSLAYFWAVKRYASMCELLSLKDEKARAELLAEKIRNSVNDRFFDRSKLQYSKGVQGEDVMALYVGIVPKDCKTALFEKVANNYAKSGKLDTGMVATPMLIDLLTENGKADVAYKIMNRKAYPSYAYMLKGESTLCEHWSKFWPSYATGDDGAFVEGGGDVSHCHPVLGGTVHWLTQSVAGLNLSELCDKRIVYAPKLIDKVKRASASKNTVYGLCEIAYEKAERLSLKITIPNGVEGVIDLPYGKYLIRKGGLQREFFGSITVGSGKYEIIEIRSEL